MGIYRSISRLIKLGRLVEVGSPILMWVAFFHGPDKKEKVS